MDVVLLLDREAGRPVVGILPHVANTANQQYGDYLTGVTVCPNHCVLMTVFEIAKNQYLGT